MPPFSRRHSLRSQLLLAAAVLVLPPQAAATTRLGKFMQPSEALLAPLELDQRTGARLLNDEQKEALVDYLRQQFGGRRGPDAPDPAVP